MIVSCCTQRIGPFLFYMEKFITQFKTAIIIVGHHTRFRENYYLRVWRGPAVEKMPPFFNARALITCESICSRDAQCNTGEWPQIQNASAPLLAWPISVERVACEWSSLKSLPTRSNERRPCSQTSWRCFCYYFKFVSGAIFQSLSFLLTLSLTQSVICTWLSSF